MIIICEQCGKEHEKRTGHVNRARKLGARLFCSQACFGLSKRTTLEEKKKIKAEYDIIYNKLNEEKRKQQRHD